mgnify:CR=1 FL=1
MKHNNDFRYDLKIGNKGENLLAKILSYTGKEIEIKTDLQASKTGNVFVEYESRGKDSGIITTEAIWYAFVVSNENIIVISTTKLKKLCRKYLGTNKDVTGGDENTSKGILLPIYELINLTK